MKRFASAKMVLLAISIGMAPTFAVAQQAKTTSTQEIKGKTCRMEQQCHWVNFKKVCTYVKVCR